MKQRLDKRLVELYPDLSRERAKALIMAGEVFINGQREDKPGTAFDESKITSIDVKSKELAYVSRGGLKLEKAVNNFGFSLDSTITNVPSLLIISKLIELPKLLNGKAVSGL